MMMMMIMMMMMTILSDALGHATDGKGKAEYTS